MEETELVRTDTGEIREVVITNDQTELIKKTIAQGATDEELKLFFYDCLRRGVHPLDKLIFFTKRAGKYTPITSIDFMRGRASETGDCAGIDDPVFAGEPLSSGFMATVTVWRYVRGHRCGFTASARWSEYCPGDKQNFMWSKMPYGQLGKCAEALALRKAFPQQIGNLYSHEEMEQSGSTTSQSPPLQKPKRKSEAGKSDPKNRTKKEGHGKVPKDPEDPISEAQKKMLEAIIGKSDIVGRDDVKMAFDVDHLADLTMGKVNQVMDYIKTGFVKGEREPGDES